MNTKYLPLLALVFILPPIDALEENGEVFINNKLTNSSTTNNINIFQNENKKSSFFGAYTGATVPAPRCTTIHSDCGDLVLGYSYEYRNSTICNLPYLSPSLGLVTITGIAPPGTSDSQSDACIYSVPGDTTTSVRLNGGISENCTLETTGNDPFSCFDFYIPPDDTTPVPDNPLSLVEEFYNILSANDLQIDKEVSLDLETIISVGDIFVPIIKKVKLIILRPEVTVYRPPVGTDCQSSSSTVIRLFAPSQGGSGICVETASPDILRDVLDPTSIICNSNGQCTYLDLSLEDSVAEKRIEEIENKFGLDFNPFCTTHEQASNSFDVVKSRYSDLGNGAILDTGPMSSVIAYFKGDSGITYRGPYPSAAYDFEYFDVRVAINRFRCYEDWNREGVIFHELIHADHLILESLTLSEYRDLVESGEIADDEGIIYPLEQQYFKSARGEIDEYPDITTLPWREEE